MNYCVFLQFFFMFIATVNGMPYEDDGFITQPNSPKIIQSESYNLKLIQDDLILKNIKAGLELIFFVQQKMSHHKTFVEIMYQHAWDVLENNIHNLECIEINKSYQLQFCAIKANARAFFINLYYRQNPSLASSPDFEDSIESKIDKFIESAEDDEENQFHFTFQVSDDPEDIVQLTFEAATLNTLRINDTKILNHGDASIASIAIENETLAMSVYNNLLCQIATELYCAKALRILTLQIGNLEEDPLRINHYVQTLHQFNLEYLDEMNSLAKEAGTDLINPAQRVEYNDWYQTYMTCVYRINNEISKTKLEPDADLFHNFEKFKDTSLVTKGDAEIALPIIDLVIKAHAEHIKTSFMF